PGPEEGGVIEQILPRETLLTRADSFKGVAQHAIVANAQQMLIVVSLRQPNVKWGLVDRMIVAAQSGKLVPIVCRNKIDLGGAAVIDTPGVKLFGLWGVTCENLIDFFPDVAADTAPAWRRESYERILQSLPA